MWLITKNILTVRFLSYVYPKSYYHMTFCLITGYNILTTADIYFISLQAVNIFKNTSQIV